MYHIINKKTLFNKVNCANVVFEFFYCSLLHLCWSKQLVPLLLLTVSRPFCFLVMSTD